ncbi:MAG: hypothetical protein PHS44_02790 [Candidatus Dojkabacteria bacterium]|nr:hypothetical protein [Candidatus Dojkabacteria bacterium]
MSEIETRGISFKEKLRLILNRFVGRAVEKEYTLEKLIDLKRSGRRIEFGPSGNHGQTRLSQAHLRLEDISGISMSTGEIEIALDILDPERIVLRPDASASKYLQASIDGRLRGLRRRDQVSIYDISQIHIGDGQRGTRLVLSRKHFIDEIIRQDPQLQEISSNMGGSDDFLNKPENMLRAVMIKSTVIDALARLWRDSGLEGNRVERIRAILVGAGLNILNDVDFAQAAAEENAGNPPAFYSVKLGKVAFRVRDIFGIRGYSLLIHELGHAVHAMTRRFVSNDFFMELDQVINFPLNRRFIHQKPEERRRTIIAMAEGMNQVVVVESLTRYAFIPSQEYEVYQREQGPARKIYRMIENNLSRDQADLAFSSWFIGDFDQFFDILKDAGVNRPREFLYMQFYEITSGSKEKTPLRETRSNKRTKLRRTRWYSSSASV